MGFFDLLSGITNSKPVKLQLSPYYIQAKELAECMYCFPYTPPSEIPWSVRQDIEIMKVITETHLTTIGIDGNKQQTTLDAQEKIRFHQLFKSRIYPLLEKCLDEDSEHAPALLLYPRVAEFNTRVAHREQIIETYERFLSAVDGVVKGTRGYDLMLIDIEGICGNSFNKVERHLADFHYDLARLYSKDENTSLAKVEYRKANKLCSTIYKIKNMKTKLPRA
jgi:hypothetical protein